ncbi:MAG: hypothetical protein JSV88_32325 [Candidatus Aminicenantes bacterium]|nr:MAG: hypothetical protein JSV88_32325 [Candidatus Aminicenantes bacterium]
MIREGKSNMMVFDSFEELRKFMNSISKFLAGPPFPAPIASPSFDSLDDNEKNIITTIYNSYKEKGTTIKQIAGEFLHILHLLIHSRNFSDIFRHLIYLEWMEHCIKADPSKFKKGKLFYRDHILHCANVCWVGHWLIFELEEPFYGFLKSCLENILPPKCKKLLKDENHWESFIKITWIITAMVHDFGYPIELVERKYTGDELFLCSKNYLQTNRLKDYFDNHLHRYIPLFKNQLKKIDKKMLESPFRRCDTVHSIIGSLELLHFLKNHYRKLKGRKEIYRYIYQLAALGIFEHHKDGKIDFDLNPFGYLLALSDTLHEWHRYICIGAVKSSSTKLKFISPVTKMSIKRERKNIYHIQFKISPQQKKCKGWDPGIFKKAKAKELERLKKKPGLPQFYIG